MQQPTRTVLPYDKTTIQQHTKTATRKARSNRYTHTNTAVAPLEHLRKTDTAAKQPGDKRAQNGAIPKCVGHEREVFAQKSQKEGAVYYSMPS